MENSLVDIIQPKEFDLQQCLVFLKRSEQEILHRIDEDSIYKALKINEKKVLLRIFEKNNHLRVKIVHGPTNKKVKKKIVSYIKDWFDLGRNLTPFYQLAEEDPILKRLVKKYYGYRMIGITHLFEALTWAVIGQQINLTFAYTLKKRFTEHFGEKIVWQENDYWLFPEPEQIAALKVSDLRNLQFTRRKSEYIIGIAQLMASRKLAKEKLIHKNFRDLHKALLSIRGVGDWTANYVMMRCFRRTEALPVADVGLQRALGRQLGLDRKLTEQEIKKVAKNWQGWEAYATFYLWRSSYEDGE